MSVSHLPIPTFGELNLSFPRPALGAGYTIHTYEKEELRKAIVASLLELIEKVNCDPIDVSEAQYDDYYRIYFGSAEFTAWNVRVQEDEEEYSEACEDDCYDCETGGHD
jgi:hypothetical protein